jgi:hypothetical protein
MRLRQQLEVKRDYHLAAAQKYQELITFLDGDDDLMKTGHRAATTIMAQARALANGNGDRHATPTKTKTHASRTPAARKAQGRRMKAMWKKHRAKMMKALKLTAAKRVQANAAAREARP